MDMGDLLTIAGIIAAVAVAWGVHSNSMKNHKERLDNHDKKHEEHDKMFANLMRELSTARTEQLKREIESERALNNKLDDIKSSVKTDVNTAVSRMENLLNAALSSLKEK